MFVELDFNLLKHGKLMDIYVNVAGLSTCFLLHAAMHFLPLEEKNLSVLFLYPIIPSCILPVKEQYR